MTIGRAQRRFLVDGLVHDIIKPLTLEALVNDEKAFTRAHDAIVTAIETVGLPSEFGRAAQAMLRSPEVQAAIKRRLEHEVETLAAAEIAKRADELGARVRAAIAEQFEERVATVARRLVDEEVEKIRRRLST